ncbi:MAG: site-specific integrase, partial [Blautia sp.]|nr:site-specific integrase [Blautia sp.]
MKDVVDEWLLNHFLYQKKATVLKYKEIVKNHIVPALGEYEMRNIGGTVINSFLIQKTSDGRLDHKGGLSNSYVKTMGIILNSVMIYAAEQGYCAPLKTKIAKPIIEKKEIAVMDLKMQLRLEHKLEFDGSLTALGISIALNTGMRIGEICGLRWTDIDLDNRMIRIRHTVARVEAADMPFGSAKTCLILDRPKTKTSIRDIPIASKLSAILEKAVKNKLSEFVVSEKNTFISPRTFEYRYHKVLEQYGIPSMNFHCLRHTFATRCIEMNVDVKTLSEILGHANVGITLNTYVHP